MNNFLKGLLAAFIGGAANAVTLVIVDPLTFTATPEGLKKLALVSVLAGLMNAAMYLKQSPVPKDWSTQLNQPKD